MKSLIFLAKAAKQLEAVPKKDRLALLGKLHRYASGERDGLDVKKLKDRDGFRLRHGVWRAIFNENNEVISVIKVGHRRDIY
jgi:mRNA interferase RelE/StbE